MFLNDYSIISNHIVIIISFLVPFFLYAEIHYKPSQLFKGFLFQKQPEIIFDLPRRIEQTKLPLALIIKDCDNYPTKIKEIEIILSDGSETLDKFSIEENLLIEDKFFSKIYPIDVSPYIGEKLKISCKLSYSTANEDYTLVNNNYPNIENEFLSVFIDPDKRPTLSNFQWGDLHCHSHYTEDQVEFGLPLSLYPKIGRSMGLNFSAITDHSYDLDTTHESWTEEDSDVVKWHDFKSEINTINGKNNQFILLPGEEISVDNGRNRTVHMVVLNSDKFFPGSGDSFRKGFFQNTELYYSEVLNKLDQNTLAFAAHPCFRPSRLERILLKRGFWNTHDQHNKLTGFQFFNGEYPNSKGNYREKWKQELLKNRHKLIYAGNDSHGFLNRFISIKTPLVSLNNTSEHLYGKMLTGVKNTGNSVDKLINGLKNKPTIVSNGPAIDITLFNHHKKDHATLNIFDNENKAEIGEVLQGKPSQLKMEAESTEYFGKISKIKSYVSDYNSDKEIEINTYNTSKYNFEANLNLESLPKEGYIRSELYTDKNRFAWTNPVWFKVQD